MEFFEFRFQCRCFKNPVKSKVNNISSASAITNAAQCQSQRKNSVLTSLGRTEISNMSRNELERIVERSITQLRTQQTRSYNLAKQVTYWKSRNDNLHQQNDMNENSEDLLDLIRHGKFGNEFHPKVRDFSIGMSRYGSAPYKYIEEKFGKTESE